MADKYNLKIPPEIVDFFQKHIDDHPELGYTFVSQYLLQIIRDKVEDILGFEKRNVISIEELTEFLKNRKEN